MIAFEKDLDALFAPGGLTADQAAGRAVSASPTVRRKAAEIEAAIAQATAAELARVPQIGTKLSYTRLSPIDPISFGPGMEGFEFLNNSYVAEATIAVPLSDYILRYPKLIEAARLGEEVARVSKRASEVDAGQQARLAYYEWVRAELQVLVAKHQVIQVQTALKQVRALAEVQRLSRADLMRVESNEAQARQSLDQLQNLADLREEQLRLMIGAPADQQLTIGEDVRRDIAAPQTGQLEQLLTTAKSQRLDFRALDVGIVAKEKQRDSEHASRWPQLSAFGVADYANPNPRAFPPEEKFTLSWSVGAQLTWQLNDILIAGTTDRRLRAETDQLRADRENLERGTRIEVLAAQQAVALAEHSLETTNKGLAASEEGYRVRRELLNADRATAVELVDAETDLTRARIAALNARVDLRVAMSQLAHALGHDVKK
ncbi:MAG: TolC family protein [Kofleriaceae bacterium]